MADQADTSIQDGKTKVSAPATKAKVLVLYTGGTIGMTPSDPDNSASPLRPASKEGLQRFIPNPLEGIAWEIEGLIDENGDRLKPLDSSSVGPKHWGYMAEAISKAYGSFDGFVILHGTDTMAYTASALSFLLKDIAKPVIITGSQLPIYKPRTDAVMNFINALNIAGYKATGLPLVPEVAICFADVLLRGNRTIKVSTSRWQGFDTPNYPKLGTIGEHIVIDRSILRPVPPDGAFLASTKMRESVATIPIYPGMAPEVLQKMLSLEVDAFVLRTFGAGNAPEAEGFINALEEAISAGKIVVNTTQCVEGTVEQGLYEASSGLQNAGVITGLDLTPEAALTKLMWLLESEVPEEAVIQMQIDHRGEQSGSVLDVRFGGVGKFTDIAKLARRPARDFTTTELKRAVLRLGGLELEGAELDEKIEIAAFINLISANAATDITVPQFAGFLTGEYKGTNKTVLLKDITPTVTRLYEHGRNINLNLVAPRGKMFRAKGVDLTLFTS